ncbi:hypothetical protein EJB05_56013, partial [Eragrostis curvula]
MSRRPRRSGINFIENEKDRHLTYFKRRSGLTKSSTDLSTLTGGKSAIVLESESGKISAFGAPSPNAIIDSFLSEHNPNLDEGVNAKITHLQDELFQIVEGKGLREKRERECKTRLKVIQDTSGTIDQVTSSDVEDLGANEVSELFERLGHVENDINNRANHGKKFEVSDQTGSLLPPYSSSCHSQINMLPRRLPWVSLQASSQYSLSSWAPIPHSTRPQSTLLHQTSLPSSQTPPTPLLHQQAHMMPSFTNEAHQSIHYSPQPQPSSLHLQAELPFNPMAPPDPNHVYTNNFILNPVESPHQNHEYTHNFNFNSVALPVQDTFLSFNYNPDHANSQNVSASQQSESYQNPVTPNIEPYSGPNWDELSGYYFDLADDYYGGQATDGGHDVELYTSDQDAQSDDEWFTMNLFDPPFHGESFGDGA